MENTSDTVSKGTFQEFRSSESAESSTTLNEPDNIDTRISHLVNRSLERSDSRCRFVITNNAPC